MTRMSVAWVVVAASGANGHGDAVMRTITQYVDQFAAQIRHANK